MVALIRSLLPGGQTLLKPETIALMMTNQLPDGQWIRFAMLGEQPGKAHGLAGGLILTALAVRSPRFGRRILLGRRGGHAMVDFAEGNLAGVMMTQRQMAFVHPFSFEFKRLAYEAVKRELRSRPKRELSSPAKAGLCVAEEPQRFRGV